MCACVYIYIKYGNIMNYLRLLKKNKDMHNLGHAGFSCDGLQGSDWIMILTCI